MFSLKNARLASAVLALLLAGAIAAAASTAAAAPTSWMLRQTLAKSGAVHSPSFITATRGWAVIGNRLLSTNDGGQRWSVFSPAEWTSSLPEALSFGDPTHGWAVGNGFVLATTDGGMHWSAQTGSLRQNDNWVGVQALDAQHVVAIGSAGAVIMSSDGGLTWAEPETPAGCTLAALRFVDGRHGWAVGAASNGHGLVLASADGGASWVTQDIPAAGELSAVCFSDASHGWAAGSEGVLRTADGGASWSKAGSPLGSNTPLPQRASLAFVSLTHGFFGVESAEGSCLWETTDGGSTWNANTLSEAPAGISDFAVLGDSTVLAAGLTLPADDLSCGSIWTCNTSADSSSSGVGPVSPVAKRFTTAASKLPARAHAIKKHLKMRRPARRAHR